MSASERPQRELRPALVFLNGDLLAVPIPLERSEVILGRAAESDVRINDTKVSRQHAQIKTIKDPETAEITYLLSDLNSRNGIFLNGQKIQEESLQNGDKIAIGNHILRFEMLDEIDREYQHQIRRLLSHDDLTGLLSSRSFFSELKREIFSSTEQDRQFCVLMMDVDHFKNVNDTFGHLTGSKTLEEIGSCITRLLRSGDAAARFGGEEFAAFLLDAELGQGMVAADRIRQEVENQNFSVIGKGKVSENHHVTISIGVSNFPNDSIDPIELVEMADSALYRAKRDGRNRVCAYRTLTEEDLRKDLPPRQT